MYHMLDHILSISTLITFTIHTLLKFTKSIYADKKNSQRQQGKKNGRSLRKNSR